MLRFEPAVSGHRDTYADITLMRFHVFDVATRIVIEMRNQEDARCLCAEMGWELICCCED
jgi:hypothetical protein